MSIAPPKRNFGTLPGAGVCTFLAAYAASIITVVSVIASGHYSNVGEFGRMVTIAAFGYAVMATLYLLAHVNKIGETYLNSKRMRYYRKHVAPYVKSRYDIDLNIDSPEVINGLRAGILDINHHGRGYSDFDKNLDRVMDVIFSPVNGIAQLKGADSIDDVANGKRADMDELVLLRREDRMWSEFPRVDDLSAHPVHMSMQKGVAHAMQVTKFNMTNIVHDSVNKSLPGNTDYIVFAPQNDDMGNRALASSDVTVANDGMLYYRKDELESLKEALMFSVKFYGSAMLVAERTDNQGRRGVAGIAVYENSSRALRHNELKQLVDTDAVYQWYLSSI